MTIIRSTRLKQAPSNQNSLTTSAAPTSDIGGLQSPKSVVVASKRFPSKSKHSLRSLYMNMEMATRLSSSCIPFNDDMIQSLQTASHRRRYMRRGSRAPSMMFQLEAAAAVSAELLDHIAVPHLREENVDKIYLPYNIDQQNGSVTDNLKVNDEIIEPLPWSVPIPFEKPIPAMMLTSGDEVKPVQQNRREQFRNCERSLSITSLLGKQLEKSVSI